MKKFLFIDTETTGINPEDNVILEFAMIITDDKLNELESYTAVAHVDQYYLDGMNHWADKQHRESGLVDDVKKSNKTIKQIEKEVLEILARQFSGIAQPIASGNSVHFDKKFIAAHMPNLNKRLHYRIIDVSSFKEALNIYANFNLGSRPVAHRALPDIKDSIYYLKKYLERFNCEK